jgi:hypothetical protein
MHRNRVSGVSGTASRGRDGCILLVLVLQNEVHQGPKGQCLV